MPNRYSLALRDRYQNPAYDNIGNAIASFASGIETRQDQARQERNQMAQAGATRLPDQPRPGIMDRLRAAGRGIKHIVVGDEGEQPPVVGGDTTPVQQGGARITPSSVFQDATPPAVDIDAKGRLRGTMRFPGPPSTRGAALGGFDERPSPRSTGRAFDEHIPVSIGSALGDELGQPITLEGRDGARYAVDPLRQTKQGIYAHELEADAADRRTVATEDRKRAAMQAEQEREVQALTGAGMPEGEARARVLTGTVKYDETYGPQRGQMTFAERQQLQHQRDDAAYARAQLVAAGQTNTTAFRQADLALRNAQLALDMAEERAKGFDRTAATAEGQVPKDPITRQITESTPEGKRRVAVAESTGQANRDSARQTRERGTRDAASAAAPAAAVVNGGKPYTADQARTRARALQAAGYSRDEIYRQMKAEGYNLAPPRSPRDSTTARPDTGNINLARP